MQAPYTEVVGHEIAAEILFQEVRQGKFDYKPPAHDFSQAYCNSTIGQALPFVITRLSTLLLARYGSIEITKIARKKEVDFPFDSRSSIESYALKIPNLGGRECSCVESVRLIRFSQRDDAGILDFIVIIDPKYPQYNSLMLVLARKGADRNRRFQNSFSAVTTTRTGAVLTVVRTVSLYPDAAARHAFAIGEPYQASTMSSLKPSLDSDDTAPEAGSVNDWFAEFAQYLGDAAQEQSNCLVHHT